MNKPLFLTAAAAFHCIHTSGNGFSIMVKFQYLLFSVSVMVVCANPLTVREILLAAEELNMIDSGEYVFFNIELFSR